MSTMSPRLDEFQLDLIKHLGLPESTFRLELTFEVGGLARGVCEFYIFDKDMRIVKALEKERLDNMKPERPKRRIDDDA